MSGPSFAEDAVVTPEATDASTAPAGILRGLFEMRDPLARIELAASQLARLHPDHANRTLTRRILEAVADLDDRLQASIRALAPRRTGAVRAEDAGVVVARAVDELAPVLGARERVLEPLAPLAAPAPRADAQLARRAALQLLRGAGAWAGAGGRLRLELVPEGGRCGIRVAAQRGDACSTPCDDPFGAARRFARAERIGLDVTRSEASPARLEATLWLPAGAPA